MRWKLVSSTLAVLLSIPTLLAGESAPAVKLAVAPKYPALTLAGRVQGEVTVCVTIDPSGAVSDTKVTEGHPMLREAAVYAAGQWRFAASSLQKRVALLKFNFVILPDSSEARSQTIFLPPAGFEIRQKPAPVSLEDQGDQPAPVQLPVSRA